MAEWLILCSRYTHFKTMLILLCFVTSTVLFIHSVTSVITHDDDDDDDDFFFPYNKKWTSLPKFNRR